MTRQIVVIGAGIVGAALASDLSERSDDLQIIVLEQGPSDQLLGSTGHAPGFVGLLGETAMATELARASASIYEEIHLDGQAAFDRVGGLEVACTTTAMTNLQRRAVLAEAAGLPVRVLDAGSTVALAPELINPHGCVGGVLYPADGTARADVITSVLKTKAELAGALTHSAKALDLSLEVDGSWP